MKIKEDKLNPEIQTKLPIWRKIRILLEENEEMYGDPEFIIRYPAESLTAFAERKDSFIKAFINPLNMLLRTKGDTVYNKEVSRKNLSESQTLFTESVDKSGQTLTNMMHNEVSMTLAAYGTVFAIIDKPSTEAINRAQELTLTPYMTILDPFSVVDWEWDEDGSLKWFKYCIENPVDRSNPMQFTKKYNVNDKLLTVVWTRDFYRVFRSDNKTLLEEIPNMSGMVPVAIQGTYPPPNKTLGKSSSFETARYIIMANNLNSASNMEVFKNAAAILLMQIFDYTDDSVERKTDKSTNLKVLKQQAHDLKNLLLYQEKEPAYLARDLDLIDKAKECAKTYFDLAIENEKSVLSIDSAKTPASGISKAYSFTDVNNMLGAFAAALEAFEKQVFRIIAAYFGEEDNSVIEYERNFDIRSYNQKIEFVKGLIEIKYPSKTGLDEAYKSLTSEITPDSDIQDEINREIEFVEEVELETPTQEENSNINNSQTTESNVDTDEEEV